MSVLVLVGAKTTRARLDELRTYLKQYLPEVRQYLGCHGADVYYRDDDPTDFVLTETWDSRGHHEYYMRWREQNGSLGKLEEMLSAPLEIRYYVLERT
jgi:quinol monooxygenase YgiN